MEFAKLMPKFSDQMLPEHFCDYSTNLNNAHQYNTIQKPRNEFHQFYISTELGKKLFIIYLFNMLRHLGFLHN